MFQVRLPVGSVDLGEGGILNDQQILSVAALGRFREIKRPSQNSFSINHHDLVVRDCVSCVDVGGNVGVCHEIRRGILAGEVAFIEDHLDVDAALSGVHQGFGDGGAGEGIRLNQHAVGGPPEIIHHRFGAAAVGGKEDLDVPGGGQRQGQRQQGNTQEGIGWEYETRVCAHRKTVWSGRRDKGTEAIATKPKHEVPHGEGRDRDAMVWELSLAGK